MRMTRVFSIQRERSGSSSRFADRPDRVLRMQAVPLLLKAREILKDVFQHALRHVSRGRLSIHELSSSEVQTPFLGSMKNRHVRWLEPLPILDLHLPILWPSRRWWQFERQCLSIDPIMSLFRVIVKRDIFSRSAVRMEATETIRGPLRDLAPQVGFEPTTLRLTAGCSAVELLRKRAAR